jgi:hypothetical protein
MKSLTGRVSKILQDPNDNRSGFELEGGQTVQFFASQGKRVTSILTTGSRVYVQGDFQMERDGEEYAEWASVTNLDSKRTATLPALVTLGRPEVASRVAPNTPPSLAPSQTGVVEIRTSRSSDPFDLLLVKGVSRSERPKDAANYKPLGRNLALPQATKSDAAAAIEHAYDGVHRTQAILAYLQILRRRMPGMGQFHDEAKRTYEQALSLFETKDFDGARECAAASCGLSCVVEIIISRTLRSDSAYPSLVPPLPEHLRASVDTEHLGDELEDVDAVLSRIRWLVENGTLPPEDRAQVRKIALWGEAFRQEARKAFGSSASENATELVEAASAIAFAAEHLCRKWYVTIHSHSATDETGIHP